MEGETRQTKAKALLLKARFDRVYLHSNGKKVVGSLKIGKKRDSFTLCYDIHNVLHPESPRKVKRSYSRFDDNPVDSAEIARRLSFMVSEIILESDPEYQSQQKTEAGQTILQGVRSVLVKLFLLKDEECKKHIISLVNHYKEECSKMQSTGDLKKKISSAARSSAMRRLRPKLVAAAQTGLEEDDIIELWRIILVEDVMKS
jgi:hypothetical protein